MEERPRYTAPWDHQSDFLAEAMATAWADPEIDACWKAVALKLHAALRLPVKSGGTAPHVLPIETEMTEICEIFVPLMRLLRERVPAFEHVYGSDLEPWIRGVTIQFVTPEIDIHIPEKWARFLPDNPVTISHDPSTGKVSLHDVESATGWHFMQIQSYLESLAPPGKPGRPKGLPKPKKSGKRPLPPDLALQVHEAKLDGRTFNQIVRDVLRTTIPSDHRARERLRAKVNRLNARGARLKLKKSSIS